MAPPITPIADRLLLRRRIDGDCWIYTGSKTRDGYGVLGVGRGKQLRAHRASYEAFVGTIPQGLSVCHTCDVPLCINPAHLFVGTPKDNTSDMHRKGRARPPRGETHPMAKLTDVEVLSIRRLRASGRSLNFIAQRFGISFQYVSELSLGGVRATAKS